MFLTTGIFAMGDARYYTRWMQPDNNPNTGAAWTPNELRAVFEALAGFSAAKLIAVTQSVYYDGTSIPDADPEVEHRAKVLCKFDGEFTSAVEIPMIEPDTAMSPAAVFTALDGLLYLHNEAALEEVVKIDRVPERRARGK